MNEKILKRRVPANGQAPEPAFEDRPAAAVPAPADGGGPINILIVDDEPKNLTVLETVLDDPGYRLVRAGSADQALLALLVDEFALLILDIRMPDVTGLELAKMIKERKKTSRVPIIFLTAYYNEDQHVLEGYGAGAVDYLHKPVNAAILRSKVAVFAEMHRTQREAGLANRALLAEMSERRRAEEQLRELNETLEHRVTERTEALRASQARLRHAADAARLTYVAIDYAQDRILTAENFAAAMGYAPPPGEGMDTQAGLRFLLDPVVPNDRPRVAAAFQEFLGGKCRGKVDYSVIGDDQIERRIESLWATELGPDGKPLRAFVTNLDITERKHAEERQRMLIAELDHRVKNVLARVTVVVQRTREGDPALDAFVEALDGRIRSMAHTHSLLSRSHWKGASLAALVRDELMPYATPANTEVVGPDVALSADAAQTVATVLHELATNAAKYGALSATKGHVSVRWKKYMRRQPAPVLVIDWAESGGPAVAAPERRGYGTNVIRNQIPYELGGKVDLSLAASGVRCRIEVPLARAVDGAG